MAVCSRTSAVGEEDGSQHSAHLESDPSGCWGPENSRQKRRVTRRDDSVRNNTRFHMVMVVLVGNEILCTYTYVRDGLMT